MNQLRQLIESAKHQLGYHEIYDGNGATRAAIPKAAASVARVSLRDLTMPSLVGTAGNAIARLPGTTQAGAKTTFSGAVIEQSRVAQAGATVFIVPAAPEPAQGGGSSGAIALRSRLATFTTVEAAPFAILADGADAPDSTVPVYRSVAEFEPDTAPTYSFSCTLSRRDLKDWEGTGQLPEAVLAAMGLGLARAADTCLLAAIVATTPPAFTLAAAAARGLKFGELAALVGTAGTGASVYEDGRLRVAGVPAELTDTTAASIVGAFNRAAVAVGEEISLVAKRTNLDGSMELTAHANLIALLPDDSAFFSVA